MDVFNRLLEELIHSIVLSRLLPLFEKVGGFGNNLSVLAIIWLANMASTKMRSYTRVAVLHRVIKKSSFTFSCDGFYFCANFEIIATSPVVRMHFIAAHYFGFWRLDPIE